LKWPFADHIATEADLSKARSSLLRAQIEPHFIFNSLAPARRLDHIDLTSGHTMLDWPRSSSIFAPFR